MTTPKFLGPIVPLVSPVDAEWRLDEPAAERLVSRVASAECGLLVAGTTGEVASLPSALRRRYVEIAVRVAAGRVPVFACVFHNVFESAVALSRAHLDAGADAVVGMLPNYFELTSAGMRRYFERLARATPGPLFLYNLPATTRMSLPPDVVEALSQVENIVGMKDSEDSAGRLEQMAARFADRSDFALFSGVGAQSVAALRLGFAGIVPGSGNYHPGLWHALYGAARAGDWAAAETLQKRADALDAIFFQRDRPLGQSLAALKFAVASLGICSPGLLPPLDEYAAGDSILELLQHLEP